MANHYYFSAILGDRVEYCKGVDMLCHLIEEGYVPVAFAETMKQLFDMMADYY